MHVLPYCRMSVTSSAWQTPPMSPPYAGEADSATGGVEGEAIGFRECELDTEVPASL